MIVLALLAVGLMAAFWFLVVSPKREQVSQLDDEIAALEASVGDQEQLAAFAEDAKEGYEADYHRLVVLGKAVPGDDDSASLIQQTQALAKRAQIEFRGIALTEGSEEAAPPAPAETTVDPPPGEADATAAPTTPVTAPATEAAAAILPIGATVGPAGLPVLPYDLDFRGDFFEIADFIAELDGMVRTDSKGVGVDGRLLTVDGFVLSDDQIRGFPHLEANLHVTTYVAPADQGLTAGATATAPAPATGAPAAPAPASATTSGEMVP